MWRIFFLFLNKLSSLHISKFLLYVAWSICYKKRWRPTFPTWSQNGICPYGSGRTSPVLEKTEAGSTYYKTYFYGKGKFVPHVILDDFTSLVVTYGSGTV